MEAMMGENERNLAEVVSNPFDNSDFHVSRWFTHLVNTFPLATFQPHAYARLQDGESPSTYPLVKIIMSLAEDDGFLDRLTLHPLEAAVDDRRRRLSEGGPVHVREMWHNGHVSNLIPASPWFHRWPPDLAGYEVIDDDGNGGYVSPYEDVGREIVRLLDNVRYALTKGARRTANAELMAYLGRLGGRIRRGRKPKFWNQRVLRALSDEYRSMMALLAGVSFLPLEEGVLEVLEQYDSGDQEVWSIRLALPILSAREIRTVRHMLSSISAGPATMRPTAKTLGIHLLAHRLRVSSTDLARRIAGNAVAERLRGSENPFTY